MAGSRKISLLVLWLLTGIALPLLGAQKPSKSPRTAAPRSAQKTAQPDPVSQAETAIQNGELKKAEDELVPWVQAHPKDYAAWFDLAYVYRATGRNSEAEKAYRSSLSVKPDIFETNFQLGTLLDELGRKKEAAEYFQKAVKLTPAKNSTATVADAWLMLGQTLEETSPQAAITAYTKAAELSPRDANIRLRTGQLLQTTGNTSEAIAEYRKALTLKPDSSQPLLLISDIYVQQQDWEKAEGALREYLKSNPSDGKARVQLSKVLLRAGRNQDAATELQAVLDKDPTNTDALGALAPALAAAGDYKRSAEMYSRLLAKAPETAMLRQQYGTVLMKDKQYQAAMEQFIAAIRLDPKNEQLYSNLAAAASENKNYPLAIRALEERAKFAEQTPGTYFILATSYDNLKQYKQAAENYHQFLSVSGGKFPDQEWQARHRLIAIEPKK